MTKKKKVDTETGEIIEHTVPLVTRWNTQYKNFKTPGLSFDQRDSKTVPGQAMSVLQLMERQKRGLLSNVGWTPVYHMDEKGNPVNVPDWKKLDLAERQAIIDETRERVKNLEKEVQRMTSVAEQEARKKKELFELEQQQKIADLVAKAQASSVSERPKAK